jgi:hypothetical protein
VAESHGEQQPPQLASAALEIEVVLVRLQPLAAAAASAAAAVAAVRAADLAQAASVHRHHLQLA